MGRHQTIDLLKHAQDFHEKLSSYYESLGQQADDEEVKMLYDYMSRHQDFLKDAIEEYEKEAPEKIRERWFRFTHDEATAKPFDEVTFRPDMSKEEVLDMSLKLDEGLMNLYRQLREDVPEREAQEALDDLLEMEQRESVKKMRAALESAG